MEGKAEKRWLNGNYERGYWVKGCLEGEAIYQNATGKYIGNLEKHIEQGKGRKLYSDGSEYEGDWHEGQQQG